MPSFPLGSLPQQEEEEDEGELTNSATPGKRHGADDGRGLPHVHISIFVLKRDVELQLSDGVCMCT